MRNFCSICRPTSQSQQTRAAILLASGVPTIFMNTSTAGSAPLSKTKCWHVPAIPLEMVFQRAWRDEDWWRVIVTRTWDIIETESDGREVKNMRSVWFFDWGGMFISWPKSVECKMKLRVIQTGTGAVVFLPQGLLVCPNTCKLIRDLAETQQDSHLQ